ncbi:MAG: cation diffusion facilitator family transporter [Candidatus Limnocylindrales bacterium]
MAALGVAIAVHLSLAVAQGVGALLTTSAGITASALHVVVGTAAHGVALGGVMLATRPPDVRYPYGYDRYEAVASMLIGVLLLAAVGLILVAAIPRILQPEPITASGVGLAVMGVSAIANAALAVFLRRQASRYGSRVLRAESVHAFADGATALAVAAGVGLSAAGLLRVDPFIALAVAVIVAWRGVRIAWSAVEVLADATPLDLDAIRRVAQSMDGVQGCHAVRSRGESGHALVDLHIHVRPEMTVEEAHDIALHVADAIGEQVADVAEVLVHVGPHVPADQGARQDR